VFASSLELSKKDAIIDPSGASRDFLRPYVQEEKKCDNLMQW
jgi:hypothetical protein